MGSFSTVDVFAPFLVLATSGRLGTSEGTGVAGEVETVDSRGKTLARVSGMSWCCEDRGECQGILESISCLSLLTYFDSSIVLVGPIP